MEEALENLKLVLTSPRLRAPSTLTSYLSRANNFMAFLGDRVPPTEMDLRRYFLRRREQNIKDGSLRATFSVLEKLYRANGWKWPLEKEDRPEKPAEGLTPGFEKEEVELLIRKRDLYDSGERFYLSIATIFAPRRIELARIKKRDVKYGTIHLDTAMDSTLYIDTAKRGEKRTHLLPEEIMPYIEGYHPKVHNVSSMSAMFDRICKKGLGEKRPGYGWHSFRRTLATELPGPLAKADKPLTMVGYFLRWSRRTTGEAFLGTAMGGTYTRPELLSKDPFFVDRQVFEVHPFLQLWAEEIKK